jgi:hypothetical protein
VGIVRFHASSRGAFMEGPWNGSASSASFRGPVSRESAPWVLVRSSSSGFSFKSASSAMCHGCSP